MTEYKKCQYLIKLFIRSEIKPNFGLEIKVAKSLIKQFPEIEFWEELTYCFNTLTSLIFFKNKYRHSQLLEEYKDFNIRKATQTSNIKERHLEQKTVEIIQENNNTIKNIPNKKKSLFDYIDN